MEASSVSRTPTLSLPRSRRLLAPLSDDRLVEQVRRGNDRAFEAIYDRHSRGILAFCRHMLASQEEAEDAVQHTFIQAYNAIRRDDRELSLKAWLYAIARNRCVSLLRSRREQAAELEDLPTAGLSDEVQQRSELRELLADIRELPEEQRAALVLSEVADLSHADIASVVGCEVRRVKALVFQARSTLIENRNARETPCHEIREQLATATGGALRRGPLRRHLKQCEGCAAFRDDVRRQRAMLAVALPVIPSVALKKSALAAIGIGGGGGGAAGGGAAGGGLASLLGGSGATKAVAVLAVAGATVGGGAVISQEIGKGAPERGGSQAQAAPDSDGGVVQAATQTHRSTIADRHHGPSGTAAERRDGGKAPAGRDRGDHPGRPGSAPGRPGSAPGRSNGHHGGPPHGTPSGTHPGSGGNAGGNGFGGGNGGGSTNPNAGGNGNGNGTPAGGRPAETAPSNSGGNGHGNGHAYGYGHAPGPAQPPAKPETAGPPADPGNAATAPGPPPKPDKPVKPTPPE
jgi:RNA polymerase sigma factor (sigma-70 family)